MRIAIIGAGNVGAALGRGWARAGHEIIFGVRDTSSPKVAGLLAELGGTVSAAQIAAAAQFAEVIVLATPWPAAEEALKQMDDLHGKVIFDCTNPLKPGLEGLELGLETSGGEQVAAWAAGGRVVKIFNTTGAENMANPHFGAGRALMPYCGDDVAAKQIAAQLATDLGFDPLDAGPLAQARLLEPLALLWITLAFRQGQGRDFAFGLLRR